MKTLYRHGGSHKFKRQGRGKRVPKMTAEQIKARDEYVANLVKKRKKEDDFERKIDEELGFKHGGKHYPHGGKHEEEGGMGSNIMNFLQDKYNEFTGRGPKEMPVEKFESTNQNYSGMDEVVDWMLEQKSQGMGPGVEASSLERLKTGGQSKDPDASNYMPAPSPDDIERKAMMFSNVFDAVSSNPYMGMDMTGPGGGQDLTEEKRARIAEAFKENNVPEEWQNEFFEALRTIRPGITQGGYSGKSGMQVERLEAGTIDTPRTDQKLQMRETSPVTMPQTRRRGLFRRR